MKIKKQRIYVYVTRKEKEEIKQKSKKEEISMSEYIRNIVFKK